MTGAHSTRFDSILVANRGEIALRVMRTAREMGLRTVAVCSDADLDAPHSLFADQRVPIGPASVQDSYLNADAILQAARQTGAGAIHPGYGFLSENADFAQAVVDAGLVWIGPSPDAIRAMGNKAQAKRLMQAAGVPCVPGYEGADQSDSTLTRAAGDIGYPIMVKAAAGGGGRGMRLVESPDQLGDALTLARSEAQSAFGSGELILERAIINPRHVEVQVIGDPHGAIIHLGERDCSVQRRHQKVVEEAPSPAVDPDLRAAMGRAAVDAARAVDYVGAGTVEFLLASDGSFNFLEMNTRLQVEHPVTEMVTGLDLVALQIDVARGQPLPITQDDVTITGHAIEARLYAEDPAGGFLPVSGPVMVWNPATGPGVRVDAGIAPGGQVSPYYDPMLAKIIAWGQTREQARQRLARAVGDSVLLGTTTNSRFLHDVLSTPAFRGGAATTALIDKVWPDGVPRGEPDARTVAIAAAMLARHAQQWALGRAGYVSDSLLGWSSTALPATPMTLTCDGVDYQVSSLAQGNVWVIGNGQQDFQVELGTDADGDWVRCSGALDRATWLVDGAVLHMALGADRWTFTLRGADPAADAAGQGLVTAPMPGNVVEVAVSDGQTVVRGQLLGVLEAMKMQHRIEAPFDGTLSGVMVKAGDQVAAGAPMFDMDPLEDAQ